MTANYPHCNTDVIHAPGECYYCDQVPDLQTLRKNSGTPYTPNNSNGWSGNIAVKEGDRHTHMGAEFTVGELNQLTESLAQMHRGEGKVLLPGPTRWQKFRKIINLTKRK